MPGVGRVKQERGHGVYQRLDRRVHFQAIMFVADSRLGRDTRAPRYHCSGIAFY